MPGTLFGRNLDWDEIEDLSWDVPAGTYSAYVDGERTGPTDLPNTEGEFFRISYKIVDPKWPKLNGHRVESLHRLDDPKRLMFLKNDLKTILGELPRDVEPEDLFGKRVRISVTTKPSTDGSKVYTNVRVLGADPGSADPLGGGGFGSSRSSSGGAFLGRGGIRE